MEAKTETVERWRERIAAQQASGQSIRGWCKNNGCAEHAFYWWRARLKLQPANHRRPAWPQSINPITFAEVITGGEPHSIRLRLRGQRELLLPGSMAVEQLAKLIGAIEGLP